MWSVFNDAAAAVLRSQKARQPIEPGQTDVLVRFIDGPGLKELLSPGRPWRVQEGQTLVATAKVVTVVGEAW